MGASGDTGNAIATAPDHTRSMAIAAWRKSAAEALDRPTARSLVVETNDGVMATAGVIEGFAGAGWTGPPLVLAALCAMIAGGVALGGGRYAEEQAERDARLAVISRERERLDRSPADELAELCALYEQKGLSPQLARQVAEALSAKDALAAHVDAEYGLELADEPRAPLIIGLAAGAAYVLGAAIPLLAVLLAPDSRRGEAALVAAIVALVITSVGLARMGVRSFRRSLLRALAVAALATGLSLLAGRLLAP